MHVSSSASRLSSETESDQDSPTERQAAILTLVQENGFATIDDLAKRLDVSTQTIRRDVMRLDEFKLLRRFHGGAGLRQAAARPSGRDKAQPPLTSATARIGTAVATLIPEGASVFLDVGTTVEAVARRLATHKNLQIVTPSVTAAVILAGTSVGSIIVTGGLIRGPDGFLVGDATVAAVSRF